MKIKMLDTVEDAHKYVETVETPKGEDIVQKTDVRKFYKGNVYDDSKDYPDWKRRANKLIKLEYAEQVD